MKLTYVLALLAFSTASFAQTGTDFCTQAQTFLDQGKYQDAMKAVGRALVKDPDNSKCRKIRVSAALKGEPTPENYVQALTDLGYLVDHGDKSETTYRQVGDAEVGLARFLYQDRDYTNSVKHYGVAKEAFQKAKGVGGDPKIYDRLIEDTDAYIKQVNSETKP
ncbi:hypothetical protein [Flavobacterium silvaticum]|uniref:Tetratricopeptide repeat protein n=1 Tax=Flavobacterium silvaticum TaxID=1852020 RepID=A0A972FRX3_9FLAO|nr:hypothetical protein [Flavobacterium silvaticum]NMH27383.1 hypothetical protein [Flavobacterium silvaticum]